MMMFHSYVSLPEGIIIDLPKIIIHPWKITLYGSGTFGRGARFNAFGSETFQAFRENALEFRGMGLRLPHKVVVSNLSSMGITPKYGQKYGTVVPF